MKKITILLLMYITIILSCNIIYAAKIDINLDGIFDDWVDKPQTLLTYPWYNEGQEHTVKWYMDEDNLYLYIKMGTRGGQSINYYTIHYWVDGGERRQLALAPDSPSKGKISIIDLRNYSVLTQDGYVVRGNNNNGKSSDEAEFRIPLSTFREDQDDEMFNLRLAFPNLGNEEVVFEAGSTFPYMAVILSLLMVLLGILIYKGKKRDKI
jgi:uncharacterized protein (TIGR04145 family)